ncbi:VanZ family protein [Ferruginibacter sp. HRS2-29]|uniref:VanZ family protein n=1 Tax=Ferruginibacter sp. HRS2-29 TaxID=2487334 RepID=UPI0020CE5B56|nr:VanZ family protein [Ferruginibacter sp. HRS2-29]MCP9752977.1 VanZ family protein [Ferruginibacter sp. HRS2-29]
MQKISAPVKVFLWLLLVACMIILAKNILFKGKHSYQPADLKKAFTSKSIKKRFDKANLKPFATIRLFYSSRSLGTEYKMGNLVGNVVGFIPLGLLLPLLFNWKRGWQAVFGVFLISLSFELAQLLFALGVFDVDDLILNTLGGLIGYIIYWIVRSIIRHQRRKDFNLQDVAR